ncbi:hypothetical protein M2244_003817 [Rhodoferax antarcticus]|nr:hypothetical protein [Rhodoferax antarcticus]
MDPQKLGGILDCSVLLVNQLAGVIDLRRGEGSLAAW